MGQINEPHDTVQPTATASHDIRAVLLLTRRDCPQCEAARSRLHELAAEMGFEVRETALESDPALNERYGAVAPVVRVGGLTLLSGEIEREELRAEIERAFGPAPLADVPPEEEEFLSV
ncbi:MAG: glutaredoxin family protein, partial [Chloroflexia bacterium]